MLTIHPLAGKLDSIGHRVVDLRYHSAAIRVYLTCIELPTRVSVRLVMASQALFLLGMAICFGGLLFLPKRVAAKLLNLRQESQLWLRIIGALGIIWATLALATNPELRLFDISPQQNAYLSMFRYYTGGALVALFFALYTKRLEMGEPAGSPG